MGTSAFLETGRLQAFCVLRGPRMQGCEIETVRHGGTEFQGVSGVGTG